MTGRRISRRNEDVLLPRRRERVSSSSVRRHKSRDSKRKVKNDESLSMLRFEASQFVRQSTGAFDKNYQLGEILGEGAFGVVHACKQLAAGHTLAVKILPKSNDDETNQLACQEFQMTAKLDHPNIAKTHELYEDDEYFYIVTDLYKGGDLFDALESNGTLSEYETAMVINSLIMSIGYCHDNKLVHRDIKPENVLLEKVDGEFDFAGCKLIDFGLSCREKQNGEKLSEAMGSLEYVAPQVLQGCYGRACDVWSVGVIAFALLCGYPPFNGETDPEIIGAIQKGVVRFQNPKWDSISAECKEFISSLLTYDEEKRPAAAKALQHKWLVHMRRRHRKRKSASGRGCVWQALEETLSALEQFQSRRSALKQATCALLASQFLTKKDRQVIDPLFRELDHGCQGSITVDDLQNAFWYADFSGESRTEQDIQKIMKQVNFSKSGSITYSEFAAVILLETGLLGNGRLRAVFDFFDSSGKGNIDARDLARVLFPDRSSRYGESMGKKIIAESTDNEYISFSTFKRIMLRTGLSKSRSPCRRDREPVAEEDPLADKSASRGVDHT